MLFANLYMSRLEPLMIEARHIVIFLYIFELLAFSILATAFRNLRGESRVTLQLSRLMVARLIVKLFYFYVEFYIISWHLNVLFNALMDSTYVLSIFLTLRVIALNVRSEIKRPRAFYSAATSYVLGFSLISVLWVDRESNHYILIQPGIPQVLYSLNELAFAVVALFAIASLFLRRNNASASEATEKALSFSAVCVGIATALYVIYVFLWDMSFLVPGLDAIRLLKPFDGVLFFSAALAACLWRLVDKEPAQKATGQSERLSPSHDHAQGGSQAEAILQLGLTSREREVLDKLLTGITVTQIAAELDIAENTAKRHVYNIYKKAGVHTRYELLAKLGAPK